MNSVLGREKLARAARSLNARCPNGRLPALLLMTDEQRLADPVEAARALPRGSAVILRHTEAETRASLARALAKLARECGLILLIAGDPALAARVGASGVHFSEARAREAAHWRALRPSWLITAAAHSVRAVLNAGRARADAVLLAPVFPTLSHRDRPALGATRFRLVAGAVPIPIYALGGINAKSVTRLRDAQLAGIAAIEGLTGP
jgi:thiamine-phosphate pyrophosphorylase